MNTRASSGQIPAPFVLVAAWVANSAWSFSSLPQLMNMPEAPNAYVTLAVTLVVGIVGNLMGAGRKGYFHSDDYHSRVGSQPATASD